MDQALPTRRTLQQHGIESITRIGQLLRAPSLFFADHKNNVAKTGFLRQALTDSLTVWTTVTVLLFSITTLNIEAIRRSQLAFSSLAGRSVIDEYLPWSQLGFAIFWSITPIFFGSVRHLFLAMLGEPERTLSKTLSLSLYAALPFALATGTGAILGAIFPCAPRPGSGFFSCPILLLSSVLIVLGWVMQVVLWWNGLKTLYQQNTGRAILTYISPLVLFMLATFVLYFIGVAVFAFTD